MRLSASIQQHEGFEEYPYIDPLARSRVSEGDLNIIRKNWKNLKVSFGYGFTYLSKDEAQAVLDMRIIEIQKELYSKYSNWIFSIPQEAVDVITEMVYQLGMNGFSKFKMMISALERGDFNTAADEGLDSLWARQTPQRAHELMEILRTA